MNIVNQLTIRHMMQNKRRTIVTIIGVIISVAMITAVALLGYSFIDLLKRQTIEYEGKWHIHISQLPKESIDEVKQNKYADALLLQYDQGYGNLSELGLSSEERKPYLQVTGYNEAALHMLPIKLVEGRMPSAPNEILLPSHFTANYGGSSEWLNEQLTLTVGERQQITLDQDDELAEHAPMYKLDQSYEIVKDETGALNEQIVPSSTNTYTVVGIMNRQSYEYASSPGFSAISYINEDMIPEQGIVTARLYTDHPDQAIFAERKQLEEKYNRGYVATNNDLLRTQFVSSNDNFLITLYSILAIIIAVIMIGSISLIYNAFGISVADRSRYLGMLASVGATKRQKRNSVLFEGLLISIISIPIGIGGAFLGLWITFASINPLLKDLLNMEDGLILTSNVWTIVIAIVISLITIMLSVWWPAKRASKISAIDAIRQTLDVKLSSKQVKTSKLTRKLFGIEAEFALKNMKRNKRRYQITIFSLVISIVLFLTVATLVNEMKASFQVGSAGINYDLRVDLSAREEWSEEQQQEQEKSIELITSIDGIQEYNAMQQLNLSTIVDAGFIPEKTLREFGHSSESNEQYSLRLFVHAMKDEKLMDYAKTNNLDVTALFDESAFNVLLYNVNNFYSKNEGKYISAPALQYEGEHELDVIEYYYEGVYDESGEVQYIEHEQKQPVTIVGQMTEAPLGITRISPVGPRTLTIFVSEHNFAKLSEKLMSARPETSIYINGDHPIELEEEIREQYVTTEPLYIYNQYRNKQEERGILIIINVFSYGFICLITLISVANILNTISTGIQLRRREFAMLRSIGMTEKGFYKMINYESILYGIKSLLYGLPTSFVIMLLIHRSAGNMSSYSFELPWVSMIIMLVVLFLIVGGSMLYSGSKVKKGSIVEAIKQENN